MTKQMFEGGNIELLPLVRKEKIEEVIYQFDGVFINRVTERPNFKDMMNKITEKAYVLVAVCKNEIVGFSAFYMNDFITNTIYISLFVVDKKCLGKHIGTQMMNYIKSAGQVNGFEKIRLEVDDENVQGTIFYIQNGFVYETRASDDSGYMILNL